ncbi:hypothetical protein OsI_07942 [Oryza sativa Indica Group]|uniref:Uncharacterized protein n=1 Tax=Oryza sativa subsp. indica TaxID=39946 RepID=A2X6V2_ORYSI|nr:hypothetical protein OsI_07942 [Oryza sativa Indica Group]
MAADDNITGSGSGNGSSRNDDHAPPPPQQLAVARGRRRAEPPPPPMRLSALYLMLFGATVIVGAAGVGAPVTPLPRLFAALVAWLVGCLSLLVPLPPP